MEAQDGDADARVRVNAVERALRECLFSRPLRYTRLARTLGLFDMRPGSRGLWYTDIELDVAEKEVAKWRCLQYAYAQRYCAAQHAHDDADAAAACRCSDDALGVGDFKAFFVHAGATRFVAAGAFARLTPDNDDEAVFARLAASYDPHTQLVIVTRYIDSAHDLMLTRASLRSLVELPRAAMNGLSDDFASRQRQLCAHERAQRGGARALLPGLQEYYREQAREVFGLRSCSRADFSELVNLLDVITRTSPYACATCGVHAHARCTKCNHFFYCSRACQRAHWAAHKMDCKRIAFFDDALAYAARALEKQNAERSRDVAAVRRDVARGRAANYYYCDFAVPGDDGAAAADDDDDDGDTGSGPKAHHVCAH
jgi:hypothetical protein